MPTYDIEIAPDGSITIEALGFKGSACMLPDALLAELGLATTTKKPEFHQREEVRRRA